MAGTTAHDKIKFVGFQQLAHVGYDLFEMAKANAFPSFFSCGEQHL